jgi:glyoxylase I family protein
LSGVRRVNHAGISVSDMDRSVRFYGDLLGLVPVLDLDVADQPGLDRVVGMAGVVGRVVFLDAGDTRLELWHYATPAGSPIPEHHRPADLGVSHVAFEVDDLDDMHRRLVAAGVPVTTAPEDLGIHRTLYARGPDGEYLELLEDRSDPAMLARVTERSARRRRPAID